MMSEDNGNKPQIFSEEAEKRPSLDIPVLDVGPWPEGLELISREEMYGDDGR